MRGRPVCVGDGEDEFRDTDGDLLPDPVGLDLLEELDCRHRDALGEVEVLVSHAREDEHLCWLRALGW